MDIEHPDIVDAIELEAENDRIVANEKTRHRISRELAAIQWSDIPLNQRSYVRSSIIRTLLAQQAEQEALTRRCVSFYPSDAH